MPLFESGEPTLIIVFIFPFQQRPIQRSMNCEKDRRVASGGMVWYEHLKDTVDLGHTLAEHEVLIAFRSPKGLRQSLEAATHDTRRATHH